MKFSVDVVLWALRASLAASFLSAVADRFGLYGASGSPGVVWGNYDAFLEYTAIVNPWAPAGLVAVLGGIATVLEVGAAIALFARPVWGARVSAALLAVFALAMCTSVGPKAALDYSVFTAACGAWLLALQPTRVRD